MDRLPASVRIVEVGPRDGLQNEKTPVSVADRVAFMEQGELVAVDAPDRLLHQPEDPRIQAFLRTYHERNAF